jgi:hypothetical protein
MTTAADTRRPARVLPVIVLSQFAGTSLWFAGNALLPDLERQFALGEEAVAAVTSAGLHRRHAGVRAAESR